MSTPVFARWRTIDTTAERLAEQQHAVADAEHGDAKLKDGRVDFWGAVFVNAIWSPAQNNPPRGEFPNPLGRKVVTYDFAVHVLLADPASD